jgi:putative membrane protein
MIDPARDQEIQAIDRPHPSLWRYYLLKAAAFPPLFPVFGLLLYFRYHTMRYRFDEDGISMSWGVLFRREIIVQYARIQDIHLQSNVVERWLGLARILVQTASGSSSAEMTIEGIPQFETLRDFLYSRMRGVKDARVRPGEALVPPASHPLPGDTAELTAVLREVAGELRAVRAALDESRRRPAGDPGHV